MPEPLPDVRKLNDLTGKVAIVTGGSRGLGLAIATGFAAAGARVVVASRNGEVCEQVAADLVDRGADAVGIGANVRSAADRDQLIETCLDHYGRIDVLVNNAGSNIHHEPLRKTEESKFDHVFDVNCKSPTFLSARCADVMAQQGSGSIINMSTTGVRFAPRNMAFYGAAKLALIYITQVMAAEWARDGIRVNALAPGAFRTDMLDSILESDPHVAEGVDDMIFMRRFAEPEEIIGTAIFLASDASSYMTGATLYYDGGMLPS